MKCISEFAKWCCLSLKLHLGDNWSMELEAFAASECKPFYRPTEISWNKGNNLIFRLDLSPWNATFLFADLNRCCCLFRFDPKEEPKGSNRWSIITKSSHHSLFITALHINCNEFYSARDFKYWLKHLTLCILSHLCNYFYYILFFCGHWTVSLFPLLLKWWIGLKKLLIPSPDLGIGH